MERFIHTYISFAYIHAIYIRIFISLSFYTYRNMCVCVYLIIILFRGWPSASQVGEGRAATTTDLTQSPRVADGTAARRTEPHRVPRHCNISTVSKSTCTHTEHTLRPLLSPLKLPLGTRRPLVYVSHNHYNNNIYTHIHIKKKPTTLQQL